MSTSSNNFSKLLLISFNSSSLITFFKATQMLKDGYNLNFEYIFDTLVEMFLSRSIFPDSATLHMKSRSRASVTSLPKCFWRLGISILLKNYAWTTWTWRRGLRPVWIWWWRLVPHSVEGADDGTDTSIDISATNMALSNSGINLIHHINVTFIELSVRACVAWTCPIRCPSPLLVKCHEIHSHFPNNGLIILKIWAHEREVERAMDKLKAFISSDR